MESWKMILGAGRLRITLEDVRVYASDRWAAVGAVHSVACIIYGSCKAACM